MVKRRWESIRATCTCPCACGKGEPKPLERNYEYFRNLWLKESASPSFHIGDARSFLGRLLLYGEDELPSGKQKELQEEIFNRITQNQQCANAALAYYNEQNPDAEFVLVDPLYSNAFEVENEGLWYHVNFAAKPKNADRNDYLSVKLFFAELNYRDGVQVKDGANRICTCCMMDPNTCSEVTVGCGWCNPEHEIYHPIGSFRPGNKYDLLNNFKLGGGDYHPVGIFRDRPSTWKGKFRQQTLSRIIYR